MLSVGILVDSELKQEYLSTMVVQAGHSVGFSCVVGSDALPDLHHSVDAWVLDLIESNQSQLDAEQQKVIRTLLDSLIMQTEIPVIIDDGIEFRKGSSEHQEWIRRMLLRLERLAGDVNLQQVEPAQEVWILAASTGGPEAVKDFMQALPANLNISLLYVQHINAGQGAALVKIMGNAGHYPAYVAQQGTVLINNTLTLITAERVVSIHDNGTLSLSNNRWSGFYAPSIDQVAANVARVYRNRCGIIVFTGMGDDGAASCRFIKQHGGQVWAQSPSSCAISSMPDCAIATKTVSLVATPEDLAMALAKTKAPLLPISKRL